MDVTGRLPRSAGDERRDEILAAAVDVFGESGFAGARIDEVARRVGLRRPGVLYHFPDKATLYLAALENVVEDITARIEGLDLEADQPLEAIADTWIDFVIERANAARLLLREMIDEGSVSIGPVRSSVLRLMSVIEEAITQELGPEAAKSLDATEFALMLASTSLVWVASRNAVEGAFGIDTLSDAAVARHRRTLRALTRQLLAASLLPESGTHTD